MNELLSFTITLVIVSFLFGIAVVACIYVLSSVLSQVLKPNKVGRKEKK